MSKASWPVLDPWTGSLVAAAAARGAIAAPSARVLDRAWTVDRALVSDAELASRSSAVVDEALAQVLFASAALGPDRADSLLRAAFASRLADRRSSRRWMLARSGPVLALLLPPLVVALFAAGVLPAVWGLVLAPVSVLVAGLAWSAFHSWQRRGADAASCTREALAWWEDEGRDVLLSAYTL